jgi:hypothetical protein
MVFGTVRIQRRILLMLGMIVGKRKVVT